MPQTKAEVEFNHNKRTGKVVAIILAAGSSERFGGGLPKQFVKLGGKPLICHTISAFQICSNVDEIFIIVQKEFREITLELIERYKFFKVSRVLNGGNTRQESSRIGVSACDDSIDRVLIHDAARPFVSIEIIDRCLHALDENDAVDTAIQTQDTIVEINDEGVIGRIPPRKMLRRGQTPQGFLLSSIRLAHELAEMNCFINATDDCSLIMEYKIAKVAVVEGSPENIKITNQLDIHIADKILQLHNINMAKSHTPNINYIKGKILVVFGGASGIGSAICEMFNKAGGKAYSFSRRNGVDVTKMKDIESSLENVHRVESHIDFVVCTAANLNLGFIEGLSEIDIRDGYGVNLIGSILVAKASIPYLEETKGGLLLFASSSYTRGRPGYSIYSSSKAALVNFAQAASEELSQKEIRVNIINPERTKTDMRKRNFGNEDPSTLLTPERVALVTMKVISSGISGSIVEVKKHDDEINQV